MEPSANWPPGRVILASGTANTDNLPDGTLIYDKEIKEFNVISRGLPIRVNRYATTMDAMGAMCTVTKVYIDEIAMDFIPEVSSLQEVDTKVIHRAKPTEEGWENLV